MDFLWEVTCVISGLIDFRSSMWSLFFPLFVVLWLRCSGWWVLPHVQVAPACEIKHVDHSTSLILLFCLSFLSSSCDEISRKGSLGEKGFILAYSSRSQSTASVGAGESRVHHIQHQEQRIMDACRPELSFLSSFHPVQDSAHEMVPPMFRALH